jgi:hypothetical protein
MSNYTITVKGSGLKMRSTCASANVSTATTIRHGSSVSPDPATAVEELYAAILQPDIVVASFFCSSEYDLDALAQALRSRFGGIPVVGCTTAGEIGQTGYQSGGIAGYSLAAPEFCAVLAETEDLTEVSMASIQVMSQRLLLEMSKKNPHPNGSNSFVSVLIDGMSRREEMVVNALHSGLGDIPLFGGSAGVVPGENPSLDRTWVYYEGEFHTNRAVAMLISTTRQFVPFKTENFKPTATKMVITEAQPDLRRVSEINGEPALYEYLRLAGMDRNTELMTVSATRPAGVQLGGQLYLRAMGWPDEDGSINFMCAIDEGAILTIASEVDFIDNLKDHMDSIRSRIGEPELIVAYDCFSRLLAMDRMGIKDQAGELMVANNAIGFSTYGEQFNSLHMNQTLTGIAIGSTKAE